MYMVHIRSGNAFVEYCIHSEFQPKSIAQILRNSLMSQKDGFMELLKHGWR